MIFPSQCFEICRGPNWRRGSRQYTGFRRGVSENGWKRGGCKDCRRYKSSSTFNPGMFSRNVETPTTGQESRSHLARLRQNGGQGKLTRTLALHWVFYAAKICSLAGAPPPAVRPRPQHGCPTCLPGHVAERSRPPRSVLL